MRTADLHAAFIYFFLSFDFELCYSHLLLYEWSETTVVWAWAARILLAKKTFRALSFKGQACIIAPLPCQGPARRRALQPRTQKRGVDDVQDAMVDVAAPAAGGSQSPSQHLSRASDEPTALLVEGRERPPSFLGPKPRQANKGAGTHFIRTDACHPHATPNRRLWLAWQGSQAKPSTRGPSARSVPRLAIPPHL